jgi:hypothetical protein
VYYKHAWSYKFVGFHAKSTAPIYTTARDIIFKFCQLWVFAFERNDLKSVTSFMMGKGREDPTKC